MEIIGTRLRRWLIAPSPALTTPKTRDSAQLTSALLLGIFVIALANNVAVYFAFGAFTPTATVVSIFCILLAFAYLFSRTRHVNMSHQIALFAFVVLLHGIFLVSSNKNPIVFIWFVPAIIFAGLLCSVRSTLFYGAMNMAMLAGVAVQYGNLVFPEIQRPMGLILLTTTLLVISAALRERDRAVIAEQSEQLQLVNEVLETAVVKRTRQLFESNTRLHEELEQRKRTEVAMRKAQRLEGLGLLTGGIAHDFNNLLTGISNQIALARLKSPAESPARRHAEKAGNEVKRAAAVTRQLLAYAGKGQTRMEAVNFNLLVSDMCDLLTRVIGKEVELNTQFATDKLMVYGDRGQLQQIVMNLVVNGADAIEGRGYIDVSTARIGYAGETPNQRWQPKRTMLMGDYIELRVCDTGCGMDEKTLGRIFEPFFTTKETGHGLGLAATLGILSAHDGALTVKSALGAGTEFIVLLPISTIREEITTVQLSDVQAPESATILIAEDEPIILSSMQSMLEVLGYEVISAENGKAALEQFEQHHARIDIALIDVEMPVMNGQTTFYALRNLSPDLKIILTSGYSETNVTQLLLSEPCVAFLPKPYTIEQLGTSVESLLRLRTPSL